MCGSAFRSLPQTGQSPAQSGRQRICSGSASATASRAQAERSSRSSSRYGVRSSSESGFVAWNDGVVSCPNGMPEPARTADALGLEGDQQPVIVLSFGYPRQPRDPESKSAEEWSREANRKPLEEVVQRV